MFLDLNLKQLEAGNFFSNLSGTFYLLHALFYSQHYLFSYRSYHVSYIKVSCTVSCFSYILTCQFVLSSLVNTNLLLVGHEAFSLMFLGPFITFPAQFTGVPMPSLSSGASQF